MFNYVYAYLHMQDLVHWLFQYSLDVQCSWAGTHKSSNTGQFVKSLHGLSGLVCQNPSQTVDAFVLDI